MSSDFNSATWTASDLLTDVYREVRFPDTGTVDYSPSVVLAMASQAIHDWAGSLLKGAGQGRATTTLNRAITSDARDVAGQTYELPPMAIADTLDAVTWFDATSERRLETVPREMEPIFSQPSSSGCPEVYSLEDGTIRVLPKPSGSGTLKVQYKRRHGQLVVGSDTASIVSIASASAGASTAITLSAVPASFVAGAWIDVFGRYYPHRTKIHGARITGVVGLVVTVAVTFADMTAASVTDDTLCIYGKTPFVQLPLELRQGLTQHIASSIKTAIGDLQGAQMSDSLAGVAGQRAQGMLSPRTNTPQKIFNPRSLARQGGRGRWRGGWD